MSSQEGTFPTLQPRTPGIVINTALLLLIASFIPLQNILNEQIEAYPIRILQLIGLNIILAVSLNLINGITGQFSLGHAGFMAIGAYLTGSVLQHYQPTGHSADAALFGLLIVAGIVSAIAGLIIGIPSIRLKGDYLAIATLGFGEIIRILINGLDHIGPFEIGSNRGLIGIPQPVGFFWIYAWVVICVGVIWRLAYSTKGLAFRAVRDDETAAAAMGIDPTWHKAAAFAVGAFFAGVAGGLMAANEGRIDPSQFDFMRSVEIVTIVVLGGSGSITGAIIAAIILTIAPELLREFKEWRSITYAALLIAMMLLRPGGFLGDRELRVPFGKLLSRFFQRKTPKPR